MPRIKRIRQLILRFTKCNSRFPSLPESLPKHHSYLTHWCFPAMKRGLGFEGKMWDVISQFRSSHGSKHFRSSLPPVLLLQYRLWVKTLGFRPLLTTFLVLIALGIDRRIRVSSVFGKFLVHDSQKQPPSLPSWQPPFNTASRRAPNEKFHSCSIVIMKK